MITVTTMAVLVNVLLNDDGDYNPSSVNRTFTNTAIVVTVISKQNIY
jgi:hypothetical protein